MGLGEERRRKKKARPGKKVAGRGGGKKERERGGKSGRAGKRPCCFFGGRSGRERKERAGKGTGRVFDERGKRRGSGKRQKGKGEKKRRGWTREKEKARPKVAGQREKRIEGQGARKNGLFCFWGGGKKERGVQSSMPKRRIAARCSAKRRSSRMTASGRGFFIVHPYTMRAPFSLAGRGMASVK